MSESVGRSVKGIVRGGALVSAGALIGSAISFLAKVLITRASSPEVFGIYSLLVGFASIIYILSSIGLPTGIARYIALYVGKGMHDAASSVMHGLTRIALISSLVVSALFWLLADFIGSRYFGSVDGFGPLLRITLITVPLYTLLDLTVGSARGYGDPRPKVLFLDLLKSIAFIAALLVAWRAGMSVRGVLIAYALSIAVAALASYAYLSARHSFRLLGPAKVGISMREVLAFSLPMAILPVMTIVFNSMDTIMIGYFMQPEQMGYYNASASLSKLLKPIIMAVVFIFMPIATNIYAQHRHEDLRHVYQVITKWIFLLLFPCIALLMAFPAQVLVTIFGPEYEGSALLLQALLLGSFSMIIWSMSTVMLTASGMTREIMIMAIVSALMNFMLNTILIPRHGTVGAAAATTLAMLVYDTMVAFILYKRMRIQPFTWDYMKCMIAAFAAAASMLLFRGLAAFSIWLAAPAALASYAVVLLAMLAALRCFTKFDIILVEMLEERFGRRLQPLRSLVGRFTGDK